MSAAARMAQLLGDERRYFTNSVLLVMAQLLAAREGFLSFLMPDTLFRCGTHEVIIPV